MEDWHDYYHRLMCQYNFDIKLYTKYWFVRKSAKKKPKI